MYFTEVLKLAMSELSVSSEDALAVLAVLALVGFARNFVHQRNRRQWQREVEQQLRETRQKLDRLH